MKNYFLLCNITLVKFVIFQYFEVIFQYFETQSSVTPCFVVVQFSFNIFTDAINHFDGGVRCVVDCVNGTGTAGIFATYPTDEWLTLQEGFFDQVRNTPVA